MSPEERKQLISERGWKNDIKLKVKVGQRVESKKWGSGRIKEINPQLDTPIIFSPDKERNTGMSKGWHFVNNDAYYTWDGRVNPEDEEPDLFI